MVRAVRPMVRAARLLGSLPAQAHSAVAQLRERPLAGARS
jgi:hypothetical protein